jgi:hypothetical protein
MGTCSLPFRSRTNRSWPPRIEADAEYVVTDDGGLLDVKAVAVSGHRTVQIIAPGPFAKRVLGIEVSGR